MVITTCFAQLIGILKNEKFTLEQVLVCVGIKSYRLVHTWLKRQLDIVLSDSFVINFAAHLKMSR